MASGLIGGEKSRDFHCGLYLWVTKLTQGFCQFPVSLFQ